MNGKVVLLLAVIGTLLLFQAEANEVAEVCQLPLVQGRCRASIRRYGFDIAVGKCVQFIYGGCDGNANNFGTLEECESACPSY